MASGALAVAKRVADDARLRVRRPPAAGRRRQASAASRPKPSRRTKRRSGRSASACFTGLERATPELAAASAAEPFDEELLRAVQDAVREYASHGNVVIVGRGACAIFGARPDVLRVFHLRARANGESDASPKRRGSTRDRARPKSIASTGHAARTCANGMA